MSLLYDEKRYPSRLEVEKLCPTYATQSETVRLDASHTDNTKMEKEN